MAEADRYHRALQHQFARVIELIEPDLLQPDDPARTLVEQCHASKDALDQVFAETFVGQAIHDRLPATLGMTERDLNRSMLRLQTLLAAATHARTVLLRVQLDERLQR